MKKSSCLDCQKPICGRSMRCKPCANKHSAIRRSLTLKGKFIGKKNGNYKHGLFSDVNKFCSDCGVIIDYRATRCVSCYRKQNIGKNNPSYVHGLALLPYPSNFTFSLRETIRKRDDYTCQLCGRTQSECKNKLHVHHIDYDKNNCQRSNLISLCHKCHMFTNTNRKGWIFAFAHQMQYYIKNMFINDRLDIETAERLKIGL